jgi:DNA polymerase-1
LDLSQWVSLIRKAKYIAFDTESTGLRVYTDEDRFLGFSVAFRIDGVVYKEYFPCQHSRGVNLEESDWRVLLDEIVQKPLVAHNWIHDAAVMFHLGYQPKAVFDTMKLDHVLDENQKNYQLDAVSERRLGYKGKQKSTEWELAMLAYGWDMPSEIMHDYGVGDSETTLLVFEDQIQDRRFKPSVAKWWKTAEAPSLNLLSKMRRYGVRIDIDKCKSEELKGREEMARIEDKLGGKPSSPKFLQATLIDELGLPQIYNKKTKKPTFDKEAMKRYEAMLERESTNNDLAKEILAYRGWQKAVSGYYLPYQKLVESDGRLRAGYKPHGTVTGRFSCADPNLQQIPKETNKPWNGAVKSCLIAADGFRLWELDYSQLEFRLAAAAAHEESLLEIFADPSRDIFTEMAAALGMERQPTKTLNYSIQYGAGYPRIMDVFGVSKAAAIDIITNYYDKYPNLKRAGNAAGQMVKQKGEIELWSGRIRHFRFPRDEYYKAFNAYIQGGAADFVKDVMNEVDRQICIPSNDECRLLLQVHDSLVLEIAEGKENEYLPKIADIMTTHRNFGVTLAVDPHEWSKAA